jgi:hypothetical protein
VGVPVLPWVKATLIWLDVGVKEFRVGELSTLVDGVNADELAEAVPAPLALLAVTVHT